MTETNFIKLPRLSVEASLVQGQSITLSAEQGHYLRNVLRRAVGDQIRLFNGRDGEWLAAIGILDKKSCAVTPVRCLKPQPPHGRRVALFFAPIKKTRMDWLIEKAVELGATDLHPVITQNTEIRTLNEDRLRQQIIEAAEQCERLDLPRLHAPIRLHDLTTPVFACLERVPDAVTLQDAVKTASGDIALLVGPEGGFSAEESAALQANKKVVCVSLGDTILRAETAAIYALAAVRLYGSP